MKLIIKLIIWSFIIGLALTVSLPASAKIVQPTTNEPLYYRSGPQANYQAGLNDWLYTKMDDEGFLQVHLQRLDAGILTEVQLTHSKSNKYSPLWGREIARSIRLYEFYGALTFEECGPGFLYYYLRDSQNNRQKEINAGCITDYIPTGTGTSPMYDIPLTFPGGFDVKSYDVSQDKNIAMGVSGSASAYIVFTTTDGRIHLLGHHLVNFYSDDSALGYELIHDPDLASTYFWPAYLANQDTNNLIYNYPKLGGENRRMITFLSKISEEDPNEIGLTTIFGTIGGKQHDVIITNLEENLMHTQFGPDDHEFIFFEMEPVDSSSVGRIAYLKLNWPVPYDSTVSGSYDTPEWCDHADILSDNEHRRWQLEIKKPLSLARVIPSLPPAMLALPMIGASTAYEPVVKQIIPWNVMPNLKPIFHPTKYILAYARTQLDELNDIYATTIRTPNCSGKYSDIPISRAEENVIITDNPALVTDPSVKIPLEIQETCMRDNLFPSFLNVHKIENFTNKISTNGFYDIVGLNLSKDKKENYLEHLYQIDFPIDLRKCRSCTETPSGAPVVDNNGFEDGDGYADWCENPGCTLEVINADPYGDYENDGWRNFEDCCPCTWNPDQWDPDGDLVCEVLDPNFQEDPSLYEWQNGCDNCPLVPNPAYWDHNGDGLLSPLDTDVRQLDSNGNGWGDECEIPPVEVSEVPPPDDPEPEPQETPEEILAAYTVKGGFDCDCNLSQARGSNTSWLSILLISLLSFIALRRNRMKKNLR